MELRQLRTFEAVTTCRTITDAAVHLGLAPSSVSEQIRSLETSLGVSLFDRGPRGMRLTPAGERLAGWARHLLDQAEQARRDVAAAGPMLRLGALESIAATHVPAVLTRLKHLHPDLTVTVRSDAARAELLTAVIDGHLDAALVLDTGQRLGELGFGVPPGASALECADLEPVPLVLVAAPDHPLGIEASLTPDDVREEKLPVNVPACSLWLAGQHVFGENVHRVRAGAVPVMRAWAERGLGIALLPEFTVTDQLATGTLIRLRLPAPDLHLRLVWRADRESRPGVRHLLYAVVASGRSPTDDRCEGPPQP